MPNKIRNHYNTVIANRTRMLSPLATNTNGACGYECILHSTPENKTYGRNDCSSHHTYWGWQNRRHYYHTAPFRSSHKTMLSETFTIGGQPGQVIGFTTPIHVSIPIMTFTHTTLKEITNKCHKMPGLQL